MKSCARNCFLKEHALIILSQDYRGFNGESVVLARTDIMGTIINNAHTQESEF